MNLRLRQGFGSVTVPLVFFCSLQASGNPLAAWTVSTIRASRDFSQGIISLAHGNGIIVAGEGASDYAAVHTCRDTINWALTYPITGELNTPYSATFGGSWFVLAGWGGSISTSANGIEWTKRLTNSDQQFFTTFWDVTYGGGRYVAVGGGDRNSIAYSLGGTFWDWANPPVPHSMDSVTYGNGFFLACGRTPAQHPESIVLQSIGRSWTTNQISSSRLFSRIAFGNGVFVITGASNGVPCSFVSTDGTNWAQGSIPAGYDKLLYKYGLFWGFQTYQPTRTVSTSSNGLNWRLQAVLPTAPRAVTFAWDRMLLAAGTNVYRSAPLIKLEALSNGTLRVSGVPGLRCAIRAASDVDALPSGWQTLTNLTLPTEPLLYADPHAPASNKRFYRAALLE